MQLNSESERCIGEDMGAPNHNSFAHYAVARQYISEDFEKIYATPETPLYATTGYIICDVTGSFTVLLSIFFPAVTGIMAGSNRSGDLRNAQRSIPIGTISAVCFTTTVYTLLVFFYAGSVNSLLLRTSLARVSAADSSLLKFHGHTLWW
ncbi:hypothetical protein BV898_03531 [Hypsibius exemplaris]|uniref:Amino acid permease/ SLC12A domain-containing protein n=1 Tax=Hypsibius exemplaris TaxID=2072580 RepID=A0A1W0X5V5_HYPEX|nr:hypothetical protein BV898_03531 [Hypsibius exemplaris]